MPNSILKLDLCLNSISQRIDKINNLLNSNLSLLDLKFCLHIQVRREGECFAPLAGGSPPVCYKFLYFWEYSTIHLQKIRKITNLN